MRVVNKTHYDTASLKKLFFACSKEARVGSHVRKRANIHVEYSKKRWTGTAGHSGRASLYGGWAVVRLPKNPEEVKLRHFAWVVCHELLHNKGKSHNGMNGSYFRFWARYDKNPERMAWVDNFTLLLKEVKVKSKEDLRIKRFERVSQLIVDKEKQLKRLTNQLKKLRRKEKYYQQALSPLN